MITVNRDDIADLYQGDIVHYSCKAECQQDVLDFISKLFSIENNRVLHVAFVPDAKYPDTLVEFALKLKADEALMAILEKQVDSHVMMETLRRCPLSENNYQRTYGGCPLLELKETENEITN